MIENNLFPKRPSPHLKLEDIIGYLTECQLRGWSVFQDDEAKPIFPKDQTQRFILWLNEHVWIRIHYGNGQCTLYVHRQLDEIGFGSPETLQGLDELVALGAKTYAQLDWPSSPKTGRLSQKTPATNYAVIAGLTGNSIVEAIFDPYLDDKALANLLTLINLGIRLLPACRILTSPKGAAKLSHTYISNWLMQTNSQAQIRKISTPNPHRRFMLLSGGQSLIFGLSLNALGKDEAAHIESNVTDLTFFDAEWSVAIPV